MTNLAFVVMVFAVSRATRIVTTDDVTEPLRQRIARKYGSLDGARWPVVFVNCDWCVGFWLALVAAVVGKVTGLIPTWTWAGWCWPAMAAGAGLTLRIS